MTFIEPLNLQYILVNTFAGSMNIFIFIAVIVIAALAGKFRMPNIIFLVSIGLFAIFLSSYINGLYAFVIIITGLVTFYSLGRLIKN